MKTDPNQLDDGGLEEGGAKISTSPPDQGSIISVYAVPFISYISFVEKNGELNLERSHLDNPTAVDL